MIAWLRRIFHPALPALPPDYAKLFQPPPEPPELVHQIPYQEAELRRCQELLMRLEADYYALTRGKRSE